MKNKRVGNMKDVMKGKKAKKPGVPHTSYTPKRESVPGEFLYRWDVINHIIKKFNYQNYLEIGVCGYDLEGNIASGENFKRIICQHKTGVDPALKITGSKEKYLTEFDDAIFFADDDSENSRTNYLIKSTSDNFFAGLSSKYMNDDDGYDAIFIDGGHALPQVRRDFLNAAAHLSENGTIFIHDAYPNPKYFADKHIIGGARGSVWQIVADLHKGNTFYDVYTLELDNSIAIVRSRDEEDLKLHTETISFTDFSWEEMQANMKEWVNLITVEKFKELFPL